MPNVKTEVAKWPMRGGIGVNFSANGKLRGKPAVNGRCTYGAAAPDPLEWRRRQPKSPTRITP